MTYSEAQAIFKTCRNPDKGKPIANNTRLIKSIIRDDAYGIKFHYTEILTITKDDEYIINTNCFRTVTTKRRLNEYLPGSIRISQKKGEWYVSTPLDKYI